MGQLAGRQGRQATLAGQPQKGAPRRHACTQADGREASSRAGLAAAARALLQLLYRGDGPPHGLLVLLMQQALDP